MEVLRATLVLALLASRAVLADPPAASERRSGLDLPFPETAAPEGNPATPEKVALGRLLFFDPILSGDDALSCAHCHHPDLGLADGLPRSRGRGGRGVGPARTRGAELARAAPPLWNLAHASAFFWDGRAASLEEQALEPIASPDEMDERAERLEAQLRALPEYATLFERAFGGGPVDSVTLENAARALAAFERTLVSRRSRYDRFAAGENGALTAAEKRGLKAFLSSKAKCSECHAPPLFTTGELKVVGVPEPPDGPADKPHPKAGPGHGGPDGAFKVPSLRNVSVTAPYMHNGAFAALGDVLDFYSRGGGRGLGRDLPAQDERVRWFDMTAGEKEDLTAFLGSLTDLSGLPEVPERVPSGLPVVPRLAPPAFSEPTAAPQALSAGPVTIDVHPGESIQDAVDLGGAGATIRVHPGEHHESVLVVQNGVTLEGVAAADGRRPVLDGRQELPEAVTVLGDGFRMQGFEVRRYQRCGVRLQGARAARIEEVQFRQAGKRDVEECEGPGVAAGGPSR